MTTPVVTDTYQTNSKIVLVTRDPIYVHPAIKDGHYIGRQPETYFYFAIFVTILNPVFGPLALIFSIMSSRAYGDGDLTYANKWSHYAFLFGIITIVVSTVLYIAIGFALGGPRLKGGHAY